ncbi:hypothetical protein BB559_003658 [Furculomyces boomerangus]|uniref:C2 domain-containing protein n=1 Tax=Furculomyces boomerangus TaxID=61424 RepID=A0A2T9YJU4_9FUNG|nr:hypothetical protein BB559_003658 [Furculomyces boomerangus]
MDGFDKKNQNDLSYYGSGTFGVPRQSSISSKITQRNFQFPLSFERPISINGSNGVSDVVITAPSDTFVNNRISFLESTKNAFPSIVLEKNLSKTSESFNPPRVEDTRATTSQLNLIHHFTRKNSVLNIVNIRDTNYDFSVDSKSTYVYALQMALILDSRDKKINTNDRKPSFTVLDFRTTIESPNQHGNTQPNLPKNLDTQEINNNSIPPKNSMNPNQIQNEPDSPKIPNTRRLTFVDNMKFFAGKAMFFGKKSKKNKENEISSENNKNLEKQAKEEAKLKAINDLYSKNNHKVNQYILTNMIVLDKFRFKLMQSSQDDKIHPLTRSIFIEIHQMVKNNEYVRSVSTETNLESLISVIINLIIKKTSSQSLISKENLKSLLMHQIQYTFDIFFLSLKEMQQSDQQVKFLLENTEKIIERQTSLAFDSSMAENTKGTGLLKIVSGHRRTLSSQTRVFNIGLGLSKSKAKISVLEWIRFAFDVNIETHNENIQQLRLIATEEKLQEDIQKLLDLTLLDQSVMGKLTDFDSEQAYEVWKQRELTSLDQLLELQSKRNSSYLSGKIPRRSILSRFVNSAPKFNLVPENSPGNFRNLVRNIINFDILNQHKRDPNTNHKLSIEADKILKLCSISWRVGGAFQVTCYLDIIKDLWINDELPVQYLYDALGKIEQMIGLIPTRFWSKSQQNYLDNVCKAIELRVISSLEDLIEEIPAIQKEKADMISKIFIWIDNISPSINILRDLASESNQKPHRSSQPAVALMLTKRGTADCKEMEALLKSSTDYLYQRFCEKVGAEMQSDDVNIENCIELAKSIDSAYNDLVKSFPQISSSKIYKKYDIPATVLYLLTSRLISDLGKFNTSYGIQIDGNDVELGIEFYNQAKKLVDICEKNNYTINTKRNLAYFLTRSTDIWMEVLEREAPEWTRNALLMDRMLDFSQSAKHSSSVWDLLTSFSQQVSVITDIDWPDNQSYALFLNKFCKIMKLTFYQYSSAIEQQFLDVQKRIIDMQQTNASSRNENRIDDTNNDEAIDGVIHFSLDTCIKLNNLYTAIIQLREIMERLKISELAEKLGGSARPSLSPIVDKNMSYIYHVEIVNAEDIEIYKDNKNIFFDSKAKPYIRLSMSFRDKFGSSKTVTVAKTRSVPLNVMNPRWEELFEIEPHPMLSSKSKILDKNNTQYPVAIQLCTSSVANNLIKKEQVHATGVFYLSQSILQNTDNSVDICVDLEPCGFVNLRISLETKIDDMEYYCSRMFSNLGRTLFDLQQRIVEQASSAIRSHLIYTFNTTSESDTSSKKNYTKSITSVNNTKKRPESGIDLNLKQAKDFFSHKLLLFKTGIKKNNTFKIHKQGWEEGLIPIVNYLENNLRILYGYLYNEVAMDVILNIWKEILRSFEDLILPQLRGNSLGIARKLSSTNLDSIYNSIEFFKWYFSGGDDCDGIPIKKLENQWYLGLVFIKDKYYLPTQDLIDLYLDSIKESAILENSLFNQNDTKLPEINKISDKKFQQNSVNFIYDSKHNSTFFEMDKDFSGNKRKGVHNTSLSLDIRSTSVPTPQTEMSNLNKTGIKAAVNNLNSYFGLLTPGNYGYAANNKKNEKDLGLGRNINGNSLYVENNDNMTAKNYRRVAINETTDIPNTSPKLRINVNKFDYVPTITTNLPNNEHTQNRNHQISIPAPALDLSKMN